jgi:telomerase reverse transcriptase
MGKEGERTMIDLILDCGIFLPVENTYGTFHQLSGKAKHLNYGHELMGEQDILWATFKLYPIPPLSLQIFRLPNLKPNPVQK